jgi:putative ABC transport system permease protein
MQSTASFWEAVNVAAASLRSSKLRSFLTLLGIILATTTLIAVMSVIRGMDVYIAENVADMGVDGFRIRRIVMMGQWDPKKYLEMVRKNPQFTVEEYDFIRSRTRLVREFGMQCSRSAPLSFASQHIERADLLGVTANMGAITSVFVAQGRFLTDTEDQRHMQVIFIGSEVKDRFFPTVDPMGKVINLQGRPFEVVGVAKKQGSVFGESRDNFAMIPIQTYFKMYGNRTGIGFNALAIDRNHLEQAQDEVRALMRAWRHQRPGEDDKFGIFSSDSLVALWDQLTGTLAATAVGVVSVFMVVGGVVIMNIMLAVVTERTHEIGIRKSVGARRQDILKQFLVESSMLAGVGGLLGVLAAWAVAVIVRNTTPVPMAVPATAVFVGVGLSSIVGLFFGIYPAHQAAKLDPIEALRMEK